MALRAAENPEITTSDHLNYTEMWFRNKFNWFRRNEYFRLCSLMRHGFKGIAIWCAYILYKNNMFYIVLVLYRQFHINVKF